MKSQNKKAKVLYRRSEEVEKIFDQVQKESTYFNLKANARKMLGPMLNEQQEFVRLKWLSKNQEYVKSTKQITSTSSPRTLIDYSDSFTPVFPKKSFLDPVGEESPSIKKIQSAMKKKQIFSLNQVIEKESDSLYFQQYIIYLILSKISCHSYTTLIFERNQEQKNKAGNEKEEDIEDQEEKVGNIGGGSIKKYFSHVSQSTVMFAKQFKQDPKQIAIAQLENDFVRRTTSLDLVLRQVEKEGVAQERRIEQYMLENYKEQLDKEKDEITGRSVISSNGNKPEVEIKGGNKITLPSIKGIGSKANRSLQPSFYKQTETSNSDKCHTERDEYNEKDINNISNSRYLHNSNKRNFPLTNNLAKKQDTVSEKAMERSTASNSRIYSSDINNISTEVSQFSPLNSSQSVSRFGDNKYSTKQDSITGDYVEFQWNKGFKLRQPVNPTKYLSRQQRLTINLADVGKITRGQRQIKELAKIPSRITYNQKPEPILPKFIQNMKNSIIGVRESFNQPLTIEQVAFLQNSLGLLEINNEGFRQTGDIVDDYHFQAKQHFVVPQRTREGNLELTQLPAYGSIALLDHIYQLDQPEMYLEHGLRNSLEA